ncbi:MAG TPA: hypothetical protein VGE04_14995 [Chloroflexia bacterium]|jgi:hypothetical protein
MSRPGGQGGHSKAASNLRVEVEAHDIEINGDVTRVTDPQLVRALVKAPKDTIKLLSEIAPVKLDDIDVDKSGRLVIRNSKFAEQLSGRLPDLTEAAGNGICGFSCGSAAFQPGDIAVNPALNPALNPAKLRRGGGGG